MPERLTLLGALRQWRRELAEGTRTAGTFDDLQAAACWEIRALELAAEAQALRDEIARDPQATHAPGTLSAAEALDARATAMMDHAAYRLAAGTWIPFGECAPNLDSAA